MLEPHTVYCERYRFFDTTIAVESDSRQFLDWFGAMYGRFRANGHEAAAVTYRVLLDEGALVLEGQVQYIDPPASLVDQAYERILDATIARIQSHILVHAGVVSWEGQALVFPAYSGHGKTTLILELVRRGFEFLSDEFVAFDRTSRQVVPFARSLSVRESTLAQTGHADLVAPGTDRAVLPRRGDKLILDIERIRSDSLGRPCPGAFLIVLSNPAQADYEPQEIDRTIYLVLNEILPALLQKIRSVPGVKAVSRVQGEGYPSLKLCIERDALITPRLQEICRECGVQLFDVVKGGAQPPDFVGSPRLEPMSGREATMELLKRFRGGQNAALVRPENGGSVTRLFIELAGLVNEMTCYRLFVGRLDEMADLCDLVKNR